MLLYITDSKKTKHAVRVEGIESITFTNNPAIITFNYLNGSKKELHMVEQDFKVPSDAYVVDKLWEWVDSGLSGKSKQLTSFLGRKAKVDIVKSVETDKEHSENKTYLRISKFHDSFVEKKAIPVDDITSVTAHSEDSHDYILFITKHKKYKLVLVYTYSDVYVSDINDKKHAANLIKDDIIDLIQKSKNKGVVTYNPVEFVSFSYEQPYSEDGYAFNRGFDPTWNLEEVFNFTENYDEIQEGKKQDACLYAFNMHDVIVNAHGETPAINDRGNGHTYMIKHKCYIQLGSTRSQIPDPLITNVETLPPLGFTHDLLGQENLEGTGKWLGSWAPSKACYSVIGYINNGDGTATWGHPIIDNPTFDDVIIKPIIDVDNKIPANTKWGRHGESIDENGAVSRFITFWDENTEQYKDVSFLDGQYNDIKAWDQNNGSTVENSSVFFDSLPNVFNPVYGMLCKEDGVYKVSVNFEDIILSKSPNTSSYNNFLTPEERNDVEAYLTIKVYEAHTPWAVLRNNWGYPGATGDAYDKEDYDYPIREHSYGPFLASERGFNLKSDFIIPGVKDSTFFKFLITIVNKSNDQTVYAHLDTKLESPAFGRNIFGESTNAAYSLETGAYDFTLSALTQTWRILDDEALPYVSPANLKSISMLHIEKIAELPLPKTSAQRLWMSSTEETTESGEKVIKLLKGVARTETASEYYYNGQAIGAGNL